MRKAQVILLSTACLPLLYLTHLLLLEVYSNIVIAPDHDDLLSSTDEGCRAGLLSVYQTETVTTTHLITTTATISSPMPSSGGKFRPPTEASRASDVTNTFESYRYAQDCGLSSLDIHMPFSPLCSDMESLLQAMSGGGRPGYDAPYIPLTCDMRWYSTEETCTLLSRFHHVAFIGDSLMRHVANALYVFLRADIGYGAIADWDLNFAEADDITKKEDCKCEAQTGKHICSDAVISRTSWIEANTTFMSDSSPLACSRPDGQDINISFTRSNAYPATDEELAELDEVLEGSPFDTPTKPRAFILHSTFWNNVNTTATLAWVNQIEEHLKLAVPGSSEPNTMKKLFMTANAGGLSKNAQYLESQGNQELGNFEKSITPELEQRGIDVLGCFNMSLQSLTSDGTHASFSTNLLKAQMVLNWLDMLET